jgi:predicted secreted acid phosphatase
VLVGGLHQASATSPYAHEIAGDEQDLMKYLRNQKSKPHSGKPTIVLDVDDTSLLTYVYDANHDFGFDVNTNRDAVLAKIFPAVFGMNGVATWATSHGYSLFFVTGRPGDQEQATIENLNEQGYPAAVDYFTKDQTQSYLSSCAPTCTTIQYKSLTRQLIESQGYDIVANVGDQFSDLEGGFADRTFKLPNPMYFIA